jgi:hypothetical protein
LAYGSYTIRRARLASLLEHAVYGRMITGRFAESAPCIIIARFMSSSLPPATYFLAATADAETLSDGKLSPDSLFDEPQESPPVVPPRLLQPGTRTMAEASPDLTGAISRRPAPPIPGLFFDPSLLLPADLAESVLRSCMRSFFGGSGSGVNQVMLFGRAGHDSGSASSAFPPFLSELLAATSVLLMRHPTLPRETHAMLFPTTTPHEHDVPRARQAIINLYRPGEGIAPHVDLLRRFGDGIVGVSLGDAGAAMRFARAEPPREKTGGSGDEYEVWLPSRSVLVLTGEARYEWTHGIAPRVRDKVGDDGDERGGWQWQERGVRVSVTFRWLLPGADIVGGDSISDDGEDHHHQTDVGVSAGADRRGGRDE